ncbi:MAG: hypothetical protein ABI623_12090 [bacterium]
MDVERKYLLHVLREVQFASQAQYGEEAALRIAEIIRWMSQAKDIHEAVRSLYYVAGLDQFALRLLWLIDLVRLDGKALSDSVTAHEVKNLLTQITSFLSTTSKTAYSEIHG